MTHLLKSIREIVDKNCLVEKIERGKCKLHHSSVKDSFLIVDFDERGSPLGNRETRPDFLFVSAAGGNTKFQTVADPGRISPIEMSMSKKPKELEEIRGQLQAGADWLANSLDEKLQPTLKPIYCGKNTKKHFRYKLKKRGKGETPSGYGIKFRGQVKTPKLVSRGNSLPD